MSLRTHTMAKHNIRSALSAMEDKINDVEAYMRAEVLKWEERAKPLPWENSLPGAPTAPNSPEKARKPWDVSRDGSLTAGNFKRRRTLDPSGDS
jgi:hypothetical protein